MQSGAERSSAATTEVSPTASLGGITPNNHQDSQPMTPRFPTDVAATKATTKTTATRLPTPQSILSPAKASAQRAEAASGDSVLSSESTTSEPTTSESSADACEKCGGPDLRYRCDHCARRLCRRCATEHDSPGDCVRGSHRIVELSSDPAERHPDQETRRRDHLEEQLRLHVGLGDVISRWLCMGNSASFEVFWLRL